MKRTTIMLPDELDARLRYEARRRGVSIADLAREAIGAYLPTPPEDQPLSFIGLGDGDGAPVARSAEDHLAEVFERRHAARNPADAAAEAPSGPAR
jgi:plasmid stability protein